MTVIYDPAASDPVDVVDYTLKADVTQAGLRVGLVSNGFPDAGTLLSAVGRLLEEELDRPVIRLFERDDPTITVSEEMLEDVRNSDIVVTALGQCGSCTSSTVRDAAAIAKLGIPSVSLVSYKFLELAQFIADSARMPDVPRVPLPHPVSGTGVANIERIAAGAVHQVIGVLAGQPLPVGVGH
jgi:hypothetical protein